MQLQLKYIPIDELKISKLNMRHGRKTPNIDDIYPSIKKRGVYETMLVRREGKKWGVVAGRRRYFGLKRLAKETGKAVKAPCAIMRADDDAAAAEASLLENVARLPADEFQQYDAFQRLSDKGQHVPEIAETFGVTELKVRRILALANLCDEIKSLYEDEYIDSGTLRALTLADADQQTAWLKLYHDDNECEPHGERIKAWLAGGGRITTDKALFDLDGFEGTVITDLFGDNAIFADVDLFWSKQNEAIAEKAERYRKNGWADVVILERGEHWPSWDFLRRTKAEHGKVFVEVRHDGAVKFHEGFLSDADAKKIERILKGERGGDSAETASADIKPEMSGPIAEYIELHRHAAVRAKLLDHPGVALRLAVAHLIAGSALWRVDVEPQRTRKDATAESLANSKAARLFAEQREVVCGLLGFDNPERGLVRANGDDWFLSSIFIHLLSLSRNEVLQILTVAMGETLQAGSAAVEATAKVVGADIGAFWSPDDAFFELLRDKRAINAMVADIAGEQTAKSVTTETAKAQKAVIINRIKGVGGDANPGWVPRWMLTPPQRLIDGAGSPPADQWDRIAGLFEKREGTLSRDASNADSIAA